jgi:hypothetical protein
MRMRITRLAAILLGGLPPIVLAQSAEWMHADSAVARLAPSAFPRLPSAVKLDMDHRGCTVPQAWDDSVPHNVVSGAFIKQAQTDWAVLCSIAHTSRILVYRAGTTAIVDSLALAADVGWLQGVGDGKIGFSRVLGTADKKFIVDHAAFYGGPKPPPIDHLGINDIFSGKASMVLYFDGRRWIKLQGAN